METVQYNNKTFEIPEMSDHGVSFDPWRFRFSSKEEIRNVVDPNLWDLKQFKEIHAPVVVGKVAKEEITGSFPRILDMPIKFPGSNIRLPLEAMGLAGIVGDIIEIDIANNSLFADMYCYLTIDNRPTQVDETQRHGGAHVDGFQGARIVQKCFNDHSYIVSDREDCTTEFYPQAWILDHLDERYDNFFHEFDHQAVKELAYRPHALDIVAFDAYAVHSATPAKFAGDRTFIRLSFSVREFDRLGNTHNPMFDYDWEMVARDVSSTFQER